MESVGKSPVKLNQCYCGGDANQNEEMLTCTKCSLLFHPACLQNGRPSELLGDIFFEFTCSNCSPDNQELCQRVKLQWIHVVSLALYNLQFSGTGKMGYYRWKDHICAFIDKHWKFLFGNRKKTNLWHGTVAGILSTGCPNYFISGSKEIGESGWWKLAEGKMSFMNLESSWKNFRKRSKTPPVDVNLLPSGLRGRQKKSSLEVAIERKEKGVTFTKRKITNAENPTKVSLPVIRSSSNLNDVATTTFSGPSYNDLLTSNIQTKLDSLLKPIEIKSESSSYSHCTFDFKAYGELGNFMEQDEEEPPTENTKSESLEPQISMPFPPFLKDESDSDMEIDIGTFSPIPACSPSPTSPRLSPSLQEMFAVLDDKSNGPLFTRTSDSSVELSIPSLSVRDGKTTSTNELASININNNSNNKYFNFDFKITNPPLGKVPKRELINEQINTQNEIVPKLEPHEEIKELEESANDSVKREVNEDQEEKSNETEESEKEGEEEEVKEMTPEPKTVKFVPISLYHEKKLLSQLNHIADKSTLPVDLHRFRRKLHVRQIKREQGMPLFDLDAEVNYHLGLLNSSSIDKDYNQIHGVPSSYCHPADVRVLSRFLTHPEIYPPKSNKKQPLFINRLIGTEDDQLQCICSPYTTRWLKPFIMRDYETKPMKMRLLEEIQAYPHRDDPLWKPPPTYPIDYCYVRPQHIPSVNSLCQQFFWPGIDLSECLQYPDFSCVVLYRKIVIGFAFMVPDVKYNEAYISFLFTHPEWCRSGIASFLLYHLIQTCMGKDVTLHVSANNPAMLLYQKFGFKPEQFILDFYDKYYPADSRECKHAFFLRLRR
ncbi:cysteine-rich protein 2-binding protein [Octopus bimaculoides]|uniref:N-acetyltransferase domain-containing protein n=1 Tax=Octopus bimaculoides TaxID=37653 RepID=A0A0L8H8J9_OCTBM|nr:cysteine-rich protein 2-binding protein [Octopus bimaculoides]|eukprot:XP_014774519.1 PREDICTED: cysteine-rich protein 2-binding protein-like [Octopus bimaculoides]